MQTRHSGQVIFWVCTFPKAKLERISLFTSPSHPPAQRIFINFIEDELQRLAFYAWFSPNPLHPGRACLYVPLRLCKQYLAVLCVREICNIEQ